MSVARLIICEKSPRWSLTLRAALAGELPQLVEVRSLAQCADALAEAPASAVFMDVTPANLEAAWALIERSVRYYPSACFLASLPAGLAPAESILREAGAALIVNSTLDARQAASVVVRHLAQNAPTDLELAEFAKAHMPWAPPA